MHGEPGGPTTPSIYKYQRGLEQNYTVINWDQRGSGKTYYRNPDLDISTELSFIKTYPELVSAYVGIGQCVNLNDVG